MEFEVRINGGPAVVQKFGSSCKFDTAGEIDVGTHVLPRYSIGPREEFKALVSLFERDFWNLVGIDPVTPISIDLDDALVQLEIE